MLAAWSQAARRLTAATYAPAVVAAMLAVVAAVQAISVATASSRGATGTGFDTGNVHLDLVLLSLIATLPLAVVRTYPVRRPWS